MWFSWVFVKPCIILHWGLHSTEYKLRKIQSLYIHCWLGMAISFGDLGRLRGAWCQRPQGWSLPHLAVKYKCRVIFMNWEHGLSMSSVSLIERWRSLDSSAHIPLRLGRVVSGESLQLRAGLFIGVCSLFILKIMVKKRKCPKGRKMSGFGFLSFFFLIFLNFVY